jgi:hypothetical protein
VEQDAHLLAGCLEPLIDVGDDIIAFSGLCSIDIEELDISARRPKPLENLLDMRERRLPVQMYAENIVARGGESACSRLAKPTR